MIVPNFIMAAAAYASTLHTTVPSTVVMQESWNNICAVNISDKLSYSPSAPKKTIVTIKQNKHNFDVNIGQISVENKKESQLLPSEISDRYKNFHIVRTTLKHCCEQAVLQGSAEQIVLSFYGTGNFKNSFTDLGVQKDASFVEVKASTLVDEELEEPTWLHSRKVEQKIKIESLPVSLEEDAFTHKESSAHDAFTVEDSPLERQED